METLGLLLFGAWPTGPGLHRPMAYSWASSGSAHYLREDEIVLVPPTT